MNEQELMLLQCQTKQLIDSNWPELSDADNTVCREAVLEAIRASLSSTQTLVQMWEKVKELILLLRVPAPNLAVSAVVEQVDTVLILLGGIEEQLLELRATFN